MKWVVFNNTDRAYVTATGRVAAKVELAEHDLYTATVDGHPLGEFLDVALACTAVEDRWAKLAAQWAADNAV